MSQCSLPPYRRSVRRFVAFVFLAGLAAPVCAQNVVPNPNFDTTLPPWTPYLSAAPDPTGAGAAPQWVASPDINGGVSGSALVDITTSPTTPDATNAASGIRQCVNLGSVVSVNFVNYGGSFLVPAATAADDNVNATVEVRLFSAANCAGFVDGGSQGQNFVAGINSAAWYGLADNHFVPSGTLPVNVLSVEIRGYLRQVGATLAQPDYKANFDKVFVVFNNTTPVRLQDFRVD